MKLRFIFPNGFVYEIEIPKSIFMTMSIKDIIDYIVEDLGEKYWRNYVMHLDKNEFEKYEMLDKYMKAMRKNVEKWLMDVYWKIRGK